MDSVAPALAGLEHLLRWRRDVRAFRADPLPADLLGELLRLAALAPSVGLSEPWRFVLVDDALRRRAVRENFAACNQDALAAQAPGRAALYARLKLAGLDSAPCQFAVYAEPDPAQGHGLGRRTLPETTAYSAVMAVHTLWLAASAAGYGLGWVSILDTAALRTTLDVPAAWALIGYFCLGVPAEAHDRPELERLGWERRQPVETTLLRR